jgi:hypothetical protein
MDAAHPLSKELLEDLFRDSWRLMRLTARLSVRERAKAARIAGRGGDATKSNELADEIDKCFEDTEHTHHQVKTLLVVLYGFSDGCLDVA